MTQISATPQASKQADDKIAIRPFQVNIPEADLTELRRRINATKWPEPETVTDASQGVQLATIQALYGGTEYWRKVEARLNALPQFITEIDGLDTQVAKTDPWKLPGKVTDGGDEGQFYPVRFQARRALRAIQRNEACPEKP